MKITRKQSLLSAFLLTLALVGWTMWQEKSSPYVIVEASSAKKQFAKDQPLSLLPDNGSSLPSDKNEFERDPIVDAHGDPFKVVSFIPPPPKVIPLPPPPPPKPTAPPFPYQYFGRMVDIDGKMATYLTRADVLIPIRAQEILDSVYQIEVMSDTQIVINYLPLNEKAVITIPAAAN
jgi:hypothetical protein